MIFQLLDNKQECIGYYAEGEIHFNEVIPITATASWKYNKNIAQENILYAYLYCEGKTLTDVCPDDIKERWENIRSKMLAFKRAFGISKIDFNQHCIYDLIPHDALKEYCEVKNQITAHVLNEYEKPNNYEFLNDLHKLAVEIGSQKVNINFQNIEDKMHEKRAIRLQNSLPKIQHHIVYNIFGQKTGGLTTRKGTFPIMNLDKDLRSVVEPNNDVFLEIDYNAAHLRVMLGLCGYEQPEEDIHDWNNKMFFNGALERSEVKRKTFAWLYSDNIPSPLEEIYDKNKILDKYWKGNCIINAYGRKIKCDKHHALNYIIASTTHDMFLRKAIEIGKLFEGKKTKISALIQDSILIDFDQTEANLKSVICEKFSQTIFGKFKINLRSGNNFGEME